MCGVRVLSLEALGSEFVPSRDPSERITASNALDHAWFKTQLSSSPSQKQAQRSNIIPRVSKQKTVHQLVPARKLREPEVLIFLKLLHEKGPVPLQS